MRHYVRLQQTVGLYQEIQITLDTYIICPSSITVDLIYVDIVTSVPVGISSNVSVADYTTLQANCAVTKGHTGRPADGIDRQGSLNFMLFLLYIYRQAPPA